jgi:membrane-associated phospholipid phosphatase
MAFVAGMILTLAVAFVFWRHRHTPIIKAAGRELSAVLLAAIFLSCCKTFIITAKPTPAICGLTRFSLGLTHTISFAAIAVKTNRFVKKSIYALQSRSQWEI